MPLPTPQRSDPIDQTSWDSGMITSLPPEKLPPDAAADILNYFFDDIGSLVGRKPTELFVTPSQTAAYTSIFYARYSNGNEFIYFTASNQLFRMTAGGGSITNITGAFTFPNGNRWYWVMFDDFAIGIHGSATERPIKIDSAGTVTTLNANAPFASHGTVWNNRLWLSGVGANGNTVFASAINDPEDWVTTGDAGIITLGVDIGDGDRIHALSVFRGDLYAYKALKINVISAISAPATLPANLRNDLYTDQAGCPYPATIQNIADDQIFFAAGGVTSLTLAPLGEIKGAVISKKIKELSFALTHGSEVVTSSPCSMVIDERQQYVLAVPSAISSNFGISFGLDMAWVLDYSDISERDIDGFPKVRWSRCNGDFFGTSYAKLAGTFTSFLIGRQTVPATNTPIYFIQPSDDSTPFNGTVSKRLLTKAFGNVKARSLWYRLGLSFLKQTATVGITINYYYNNYLTVKAGDFSHSSNDAIPNRDRTLWRSFKKNDSGRKANLVQVEVIADTADQGITLKSLFLDRTQLNHRRSQTEFVSD